MKSFCLSYEKFTRAGPVIPKILHCASFCRSFVAHSGRILDMKALLTNNTKVFISSSNDKSIKVCENETERRRGARIGKPGKTPRSYQNLIAKISSPEAAESQNFCDWRGGGEHSKTLFCGAPSTFTYPAVLILVALIVLRLLYHILLVLNILVQILKRNRKKTHVFSRIRLRKLVFCYRNCSDLL